VGRNDLCGTTLRRPLAAILMALVAVAPLTVGGYRADRETVALEGVPIGGGYDSLGFPPPCGEGKPS
jgi:hypothetical protein